MLFSAHTVGHGSLSSCILRVDLGTDLIVVQVRKEAGPRFGEWAPRFFQSVSDAILLDGAAGKAP